MGSHVAAVAPEAGIKEVKVVGGSHCSKETPSCSLPPYTRFSSDRVLLSSAQLHHNYVFQVAFVTASVSANIFINLTICHDFALFAPFSHFSVVFPQLKTLSAHC